MQRIQPKPVSIYSLVRRLLQTQCRPLSTQAAETSRLSQRQKLVFDNRKTLKDFMHAQTAPKPVDGLDPITHHSVPYLGKLDGNQRKFYIEVYGCQMNTNDTEILNSILTSAGFVRTLNLVESDIVFLMTCAIRENAEGKIWNRLKQIRALKTKLGLSPLIGVLGCMAERLRDKLLDHDKLVDVVCGPDAYRSLPTLLALAQDSYQVANVMLSADETYADIMPLRLDANKVSAFLSIMRGCNNHCAFCIVPFTRGIERSRPVVSILDEVRRLSDQGVREVTLLGQNVNSYRDESSPTDASNRTNLAKGFTAIYKPKEGGLRFADLLDQVARIDPEMRIRFTSPHPKDFPNELIQVIASHHNICNQIHLPAQSGSSSMLSRMRRGYSREAYLTLVDHIRTLIPNVALSTDLISGFCGETDAEHLDTISLIKQVQFDQAFMFAYSMRDKTLASRKYVDDVPEHVKSLRLNQIIDTHFQTVKDKHQKSLLGTNQLVLVEGLSRRSVDLPSDTVQWSGRAENNVRCHIDIPRSWTFAKDLVGKYVLVKVHATSGASMSGTFEGITSIQEWYGSSTRQVVAV